MKVTYYGHACFGLEIGRQHYLVDPFISPNPKAAEINVSTIPADFVLLTHGHEDHVADAVEILKRTGALGVAPYETAMWLQDQGIENVQAMNHGGSSALGAARIKMVNAVHSSVLPDGRYGGNPAGYVVESEAGNAYLSGDTALHYDMKLLGELHDLNWAALCIGDNFTMGAEDAARAAEWVGVKKVLGLHYDTFPPIEIDHASAKQSFAERGIELVLAGVGEELELP